MKTELLTEAQLRAAWSRGQREVFTAASGTVVTPAARDFLREHGMELRFETAYRPMPMAEIPREAGKPRYVDAATGETRDDKPEGMTHLHGAVLVPKTHPRIAFRGKLDSLAAEILSVQVTAHEAGRDSLAEELEELRAAVLDLLSAEVLERSAKPLILWDMDTDALRYASHHVKECCGVEHLMPHWRMGRLAVALNRLRTQIRETELSAAAAFGDERGDIVETLNRLSSGAYILYCRLLAQSSTEEHHELSE